MSCENDLLKYLISLIGRVAFSKDTLIEILNKGGSKQIKAYNLCDGTKTQNLIATEANIDKGNFSRIVNRWISLGILTRLGEGSDTKLLHVYPISEESFKKVRTKK